MHEATTPVFAAWSNFYVITGSSAAALTGLMFVVVTLVAGARSQPPEVATTGFSAFSTPTVVHFGTAFVISGLMSAPWKSFSDASLAIGVIGVFGIAYVLRIVYLTQRLTEYQPMFDDWIWYAILPLIGYVAILASAIALQTAASEALFALAGGTMLLIVIGIHNAWDVVTYLVTQQVLER